MSGPLLRKDYQRILHNLKPGDVVARECKHATYSTHREGQQHDHLTVKEYLILKDGTRVPNVRCVEDYQRPYWVEQPHGRNYPEKIQFRDLKFLDRFKSTQIKLRQDICFRLGHGNPTNTVRQLARAGSGGQYLYGLDPGPEVFMKYSYMAKWPDQFAPNKVTVIDAEVDVFKGTGGPENQPPILWSLVSDDEIVLYADRQWCIEIPNYADQILVEYHAVLDQWIGMAIKKMRDKKKGTYPAFLDQIKNIPVRVEMYDGDFAITQAMIDRLHDTMPDIVTGWNVFFDAQVMSNTCQRHDRDPADIFSDPKVPYEYRGVYLQQGKPVKRTDNGREMRLDPQERWNIVLNTASWRMQDAMQAYWQLRKAKGKESGGYGLDAILTRQLGLSKLKYDVEDSSVPPGTLHWHMDMQKNYKVRYGVYNIFDSIGVWVLDKKNNDLSSQISSLAGACDYSRFNSQPTINSIDKLFTVMKKRGKVICSTSDEMRDELDEHILGKDGWIVTFPSHNVTDTGLFLFEDMPDVQSSIHMFNADADVETTYPTAQIIQNISKETTLSEPCRILGISPEAQRLACINVTGGRVNSIEIMQSVCKMPTLDQWLELARQETTCALD